MGLKKKKKAFSGLELKAVIMRAIITNTNLNVFKEVDEV